MINVDDIAELIGIIAWEGRGYLLNKKTSLILPAITCSIAYIEDIAVYSILIFHGDKSAKTSRSYARR